MGNAWSWVEFFFGVHSGSGHPAVTNFAKNRLIRLLVGYSKTSKEIGLITLGNVAIIFPILSDYQISYSHNSKTWPPCSFLNNISPSIGAKKDDSRPVIDHRRPPRLGELFLTRSPRRSAPRLLRGPRDPESRRRRAEGA